MGKHDEIKEGFRKWHEEAHGRHKEIHKQHCEYDKQREELHRRVKELHKSRIELRRMHRHVRFSPPIIMLLNLLIWYLVFRYAGIKVISVFFAALFTVGGCYEFFFLRKLESRILTPIDRLKAGIEEISKGNYDVKVEGNEHNEISLLIDSFNEMAQKLQDSEKVKAEYEENRRRLIANISHDLKTPITSIQGYIEAINEWEAISPEDVGRYLKIIQNNTSYMNKLIDDLFLFSKLDMQKLEFQFETVGIRPFVNDLMEEFKLEFEEKDISFDYYDNLGEEGCFNVDRKRLNQVLRNIIGNSVKYGDKESLFIKAELYNQDGYACIDIRDNGPGIPEDKLPHIFERFYRIDTERTKDFMSTGLGLAIAKELMEAHGGRIKVSSVENEGSCFTIMLPIIQ